jgi:hypothetical protein
VSYPGDGSHGGDAIPLADLVHLGKGLPIYAAASAERYNGANWGPLYYLTGVELVDPETPSSVPLRVVSLTALAICALGGGLLAFWLTRSHLAAALAPLLFLAYGFVTWTGVSVRCDTIALLLSFSGFLAAYRFRQSAALLLSVPLLLLGFFYKPMFLAAPLTILVFLLVEKRWRLAFWFGGLLAVGGLLGLAIFQFYVFPGQAFFHHFVLYNMLPYGWSGYFTGLLFFLVMLLTPFVAADRFLRSQPDRLLHCYLGFSFLTSLVLYSRAGSNVYYSLELVLILSALVAALFADTKTASRRLGTLVALLAITFCIDQITFTTPAPTFRDVMLDQALQEHLREHFPPGTAALGYYSADLLRAGLDAPITNLYHYTQLVALGTIAADGSLADQVRSQKYGVVLLTYDIENQGTPALAYLPPPVEQAVRQRYRLSTTLEMPGLQRIWKDARYYVWVPRREASHE